MNRLIDSLVPHLPRSVRRSVRRRIINPIVRHFAGLQPVSATLPEDVFICGYPRSGHTWMQYLISAVVFGVNAEFASDSLVNDLVTDTYLRDYYRRYGPVHYFKTHELPRPEFRRIVYLLRDGRDVLVSYHHYESAIHKRPMDFLKMLENNEFFPCPWEQHVQGYLANPYKATILTIRYEDLHADPAAQMRRFRDFLKLPLEDAWIDAMTATTVFDKMQKRETRLGWENPRWTSADQFVRRGKIGSYKDEMPADVLAAFLRRAGPTLSQCGYDDVKS